MIYMCDAVIGQNAEKVELGQNVKGIVCKNIHIFNKKNEMTNVVPRAKTLNHEMGNSGD